MSLISDMLPAESQLQLNSAGGVGAAAATLTTPGVSCSSGVSSCANSNSVVFVFPASFSSTGSTSSMHRLQTGSASCSSQQTSRQLMSGGTVASTVRYASSGTLNSADVLTPSGGTLSSSLPGTVRHRVAASLAGRHTVVSNLQNADGLSQFLSSLVIPQSASPTRVSQCVTSQTPLRAPGPVTAHSVLPSPPVQLIPVVPRSETVACLGSVNTAATSAVASTARLPPQSVVKLPVPRVTSLTMGSGVRVQTGARVPLRELTQSAQNYRVFRLQPPQQQCQPSRPSRPQFNLSSVYTIGVNVTSACSAQPAPSVITVPSLYEPRTASVTSASSDISLIASTSGGHVATDSVCTSTSADEFVDIETISTDQLPPIVIAPDSTNQLPPIVIAPDDTIDDYNLPPDCAVQDVDIKNERMSPRLRKSTLRRPGEVICIDDDDGLDDVANSSDNGTQESLIHGTEDTETNLQMCFDDETNDDHALPNDTDDIPAINIVPDDASCSPVQFDYSQASDTSVSVDFSLPSSTLSGTDTTLPGTLSLCNSDTVTVAPLVASCTASSNMFSTCVSSTCTSSLIETDGTYLASLANALSAQVAEARSSLAANSAHTIHYLPSRFNLSSASVYAHRSLSVSSAFSANVITPRPIRHTPVTPVLFTVQQPFCVVPTLVSLQPPPVSSVPLVTLAPLAPTIARTCDVTAMATQLNTLVPLAPSIARTCDVTAMATQLVSGLRSDAMRRRATSAAKVAVPQSTQPEPASTESRKKRTRKDDDSDADVPSKSPRYSSSILNRSNRPAKEPTKHNSEPVSSNMPEDKKQGETVVYHLNDDGSIEIRIEKGSIAENSSQRRKQALKRGGFDAVVELGCNASQSWYSETFLSDMEKRFNNLQVVTLSGTDSATSNKSLNVPELRTADGAKRKLTSDADKILDRQNDDNASDSDSQDTVSLVYDSVEPSDEEDDQPPAADQEETNSSSLKITNICSIDAEAFTDLNSVVSDVPQETASVGQAAEDVEICRRSGDVRGIDANVNTTNNKNDRKTPSDKHNIGTSTLLVKDSNLSAECHAERAHHKSSRGNEEEMFSDSGDTDLFEVSLEGDLLIDTETESIASPAKTGSGEAVEQLPSVSPDAEAECTVEPAKCSAADETVSNDCLLYTSPSPRDS